MAYPTRDALIVPYSTNMNTRLVASGVLVYKLTSAQVTGYTAVHDPYIAAQTALVAARESGTRSESQTALRDACRKSLVDYGREIYGLVAANQAVSDADKVLLGIHLRARRAPIPVPSVQPGLEVIGVEGRTVSVRVYDAAHPTRRARPAGVLSAFVYSHVGTEYPADLAAWTFEGATTKSKFKIVFPNSVAGGTQVWLKAAWANAKQQAGDTCVPVTTVVQWAGTVGGGAAGGGAETTLKVAA